MKKMFVTTLVGMEEKGPGPVPFSPSSKKHRTALLAGIVLVAFMVLTGPVTYAAEAASHPIVMGANKEIFGSQEAADLVVEARKYDANYGKKDQRDREKAAALYEKAIAAQPGAPINAALADRVAQMYAYNADSEKGILPDREKAVEWWKRCLEYTDEKQLLWGQAQMGLACTYVVGHDGVSAEARLEAIENMDPTKVELPRWIDWQAYAILNGPADVEAKKQRLRANVEDLIAQASKMNTSLRHKAANNPVARNESNNEVATQSRLAGSEPPAAPEAEKAVVADVQNANPFGGWATYAAVVGVPALGIGIWWMCRKRMS